MHNINRTRLATAMCCAGVVVTGLFFEPSIFSHFIVAAWCIGSLCYGARVLGSRIKAAKLFLINAGLLALIFTLLRETLNNFGWRLPREFWSWLHRIFRVWWFSECSAIILAFIAAGLVTIEVAGRIGGDVTRKRFQWSTIVAASILVAINIAHFLRPAWCSDCFFPYGMPFTLYTDGGYAGGAGFVWTGLIADAALIPAFATICTLVRSRIAK